MRWKYHYWEPSWQTFTTKIPGPINSRSCGRLACFTYKTESFTGKVRVIIYRWEKDYCLALLLSQYTDIATVLALSSKEISYNQEILDNFILCESFSIHWENDWPKSEDNLKKDHQIKGNLRSLAQKNGIICLYVMWITG